jgi:hypothetical protein
LYNKGGARIMRRFILKRIAKNDDGTFGVLIDGVTPFCLTVERPWINNQTGISCIPDGFYLCKRVDSPRFGNTFEVIHVPNRTAILFHKGNIDDDSRGCIIVGEQYGYLDEKVAVLASGLAFNEFIKRLEYIDEFELTISTV